MSIEEEVARLSALLVQERAQLRSPGHEQLWPAVSETTGRAVVALVKRIERERPELFGRYGSLEELQVAVCRVELGVLAGQLQRTRGRVYLPVAAGGGADDAGEGGDEAAGVGPSAGVGGVGGVVAVGEEHERVVDA